MSASATVAAAAAAPTRTFGAVLSDYVAISKPRILVLLLAVAWAAMFAAADGLPPLGPFVAVTLAGTFSVAAAGAFNNVAERARDRQMARTAQRPVAAGRVSVAGALTYASVMAAASFAALGALGLWLAAALTVGAIAYYAIVYTLLLKPATPQNIVIGGLAGSFPAIIGWTAVTGTLHWPAAIPALALALLVFVWTPPHFWALALVYRDDYAAAGYPMMPNVRGEASTTRQMAVYAVLTLGASLLLLAGPAPAGWLYAVAAVALGAVFVGRAFRLLGQGSVAAYRSYFFFTIQYLGLVLMAYMADRALVAAVPAMAL
jgi:heme o synthase